MYKFLLLAVVAVGLTACGTETTTVTSTHSEQPAVKVIRDYGWAKLSSSSDQKETSTPEYIEYKFDTNKRFMFDQDGNDGDEIHKEFTYEWQEFLPRTSSIHKNEYSPAGPKHTLTVPVEGLITAEDKLKQLLQTGSKDPESQIKQAVYGNLILPMSLTHTSLTGIYSFDRLTKEIVPENRNFPLCSYTKEQDTRTDFSMSCSIPADLNIYNKYVSVDLEQTSSQPVYYKTNTGHSYQAYEFIQVVSILNDHNTFDNLPVATVLIHPGLGIISMDLPTVNGTKENGINVKQSHWIWRNSNDNLLDQY